MPAIVLGLMLGAAANAQAAVVASPSSLSFGPVQADPTSEVIVSTRQNVTLTNDTPAAPVTITGLSKTENPTPKGAVFGLIDGTCRPPVVLDATTPSCTLQVDYRPKRPTPAGSPHSGTVNVAVDNAGGPIVTLSGAATPSPQRAALSPSALTFVSQAVGSTSPAQTVTVKNAGNAPLGIADVTITGANPRDFALAAQDCKGKTLAAEEVAEEACKVGVTFAPTAAGARSATLHFTDDAADTPDDVALTGTATPGVAGPGAALKPLNAKILGRWRVGQKSSRLLSLSVTAAVASRIVVGCVGKRGACPFRTKTVAKTRTRATNLAKYFKSSSRVLPAGTSITIRVTRAGRLGTYQKLQTRAGRKQPKVTARCLDAGDKAIACP